MYWGWGFNPRDAVLKVLNPFIRSGSRAHAQFANLAQFYTRLKCHIRGRSQRASASRSYRVSLMHSENGYLHTFPFKNTRQFLTTSVIIALLRKVASYSTRKWIMY